MQDGGTLPYKGFPTERGEVRNLSIGQLRGSRHFLHQKGSRKRDETLKKGVVVPWEVGRDRKGKKRSYIFLEENSPDTGGKKGDRA